MIPQLSSNAFKFLRNISKKAGLVATDEEIHDMAIRLLTLCELASKTQDRQVPLNSDLTEAETQAVTAIREHFTRTGNVPSARELSQAMGYRSSRSGHLLLKRLLNRGILKRQGITVVLRGGVASE